MSYGMVDCCRKNQKKPDKKNEIIATIIIVLILLLLSAKTCMAMATQTIQGKVMQVKDGDTVTVGPIEGGQLFICRLYGIDAPETARRGRAGQPYGDDATKKLKRLVLGQSVNVQLKGRKTHGREVCIIRKNGTDINREMIRSGYAWAYRKFLERPYASEYISAEDDARANRRGLWQQNNPTPPWEWRRANRSIGL